MIHTVDISIISTKELYEAFMRLPDTRWIEKEQIFLNTRFNSCGIDLVAQTINTPNYGAYQIRINKLNLSKLMMPDEHVRLIDVEQMQEVEKRFDELIDSLNIGLPHLKNWSLTRCDYCLNVKTPYVKEYIHLLQKGSIPYTHRLEYNEHRNYTHLEGSAYLKSNLRKKKDRSLIINFYDKHHEMVNDKEKTFTTEQLEHAKGILRLEIQCLKPKVNSIVRSGKYEDVRKNNLVDFMKPYVSYGIISWYLDKVSKNATFQRRPVAHEMIDRYCQCKKAKKELLHQIVDNIAIQNGSVQKTREKFIGEGILTAEKFDAYIDYLALHDINAVTISHKQTIKGKKRKEGLDSIQKLLYNAFWGDYMKTPLV